MQDLSLEHLILTDGNIVIRSAHPTDEQLLTLWFTDPEVYRYWGGKPPNPEEIKAHCSVERNDDTCWPFIIVHDAQAAGFIQAWVREDLTGGLDLFITPKHRRKNVATRTLRLLANYLRDAGGWKRVTVDPSIENTAAIAVYERAGFRDSGERFTEQDQVHMLLEFR